MNMSKAFNTLDHSQLLAKSEACGFDTLSLEFMRNYQTNRKQRYKVGICFNIWRKITSGIPQGPILAPLLFNNFINNIFLFSKNSTLCSQADVNIQFSCEKNTCIISNNQSSNWFLYFCTLKVWFYDNFLALNPKKCHFMTLRNRDNLLATFHVMMHAMIQRCMTVK